ncbi:MAG: tRNA (adenosine(37)-N6)-threonylcarbamoyltransferase complex ATPase subunit type 1 TsaE [Chlamydiota bacterium]
MPSQIVSLSKIPTFGQFLAKTFFHEGWIGAFEGSLGSGKTTLIRAALTACDYPSHLITSPTFSYMHRYEAPNPSMFPVYHFDLYRLNPKDPSAFVQLGFLDHLEEKAVCLIEWPDRIQSLLPKKTTFFQLSVLSNDTREISWTE